MSQSFSSTSKDHAYWLKNYTEQLAIKAAHCTFSSVRHYFLTSYIPEISKRDNDDDWQNYQIKHRFVPDNNPKIVTGDFILNRWNTWLDCKELKKNSEYLGVERTAYFVKRAELLASLATHPYEKAGSLLKVFKEYRDEIEAKIGRRVKPRHAVLRNDMSDFMMTYATVALAESDDVITAKGPGFLINQSLIAASDDKSLNNDQRKTRQLKTLYISDSHKIDNVISRISRKSDSLGAMIKAIPPEAVYMLDWHYGGIHRRLYDGFTRKPNEAFVLEHYLLAKNDKSWDRKFFVDAVLRKLPDVVNKNSDFFKSSEDVKNQNIAEVQKHMIKKGLAPCMEDKAFNEMWLEAEKNAWADYIRIRKQAFVNGGECTTHELFEPSAAELRPELERNPLAIFQDPYTSLEQSVKQKLLNRVVQGLGDRYEKLLTLKEALDISDENLENLFEQANRELSNPETTALDVTTLDVDISDLTDNISI